MQNDTAPARLSPEDFIGKIKDASEWLLLYNPHDDHILELYIKEGESITCYLTPDFLEMRELEVRLFFARLSQVTTDPERLSKRIA